MLQRWQREERRVPAARTASNRCRYTESQLRAFLRLPLAALPQRIVAYCRVSSAAQRPDLVNQRHIMEQFAAACGLEGGEYVEEVGGGLSFGRKCSLVLMDTIGRGELATLVLNQERLSPEQEMVQDLMMIVGCFSNRLYGLRNYRR